MYHEVSVEKLSPVQHSRLRNGHRVRVKVGAGSKLHLSAEQAKKLHRAHSKGAGVIIQLDQQQHHQKEQHKGK